MVKNLLKEQIYEYVTAKLQNRDFVVGDKLTEESLAKALGVSRTPVREALNQIAFEGFITKVPYKGFYINSFDLDKFKDVYSAIAIVDSAIAKLACPLLDESDYKKFEELIAKIDIAIKFENFSDYSDYQIEFHKIYADKCPNSILKDTLHSLKFSHVPHTYMGTDKDVFKAYALNNLEHVKILQAFKEKDLSLLSELVHLHWAYISDEKVMM